MQTDQILKEFWEDNFNDYQMHLFQVFGNDGRKFTNKDIRTVLRNADALRSGRVQDMDTMIDVELVRYLAAFVNSEKVLRMSNREGGEVAVCRALDEMIKAGEMRGKAEGKAEGIAEGIAESVVEFLEELGTVPMELRKRIMEEKNLEILRKWCKQAARVESVSQFREIM